MDNTHTPGLSREPMAHDRQEKLRRPPVRVSLTLPPASFGLRPEATMTLTVFDPISGKLVTIEVPVRK